MGFISEFKEFAMKGNVMDMAIGVIIGGAFGKIVNSLIEDIITPIILKPALEAAGAASIETWAPGGMLIGKFISAVISFIVIAFVLFLIIKGLNKMKKPEPAPAPSGPTQEELLTQIRDLLKK
ncbi:large conductance mechanosensitive channel protein MscL [Flavobacterium suncheonense]|uniref:Large-conductance mechanosensitive channel n=1 Tax=Flavobacterium suncheonense GH29-5 = DSM 17707 TaxID=1121899 RepID=A0A0A2MFL0_9FLAO|nr:large conductance mechanosensitive channel protein MscL [Flavobacterium suncheonense]KGO90391.1 mechanosensitive ion channel protein MscL [Flavobacterium suncheonense GH29-5 = DSM 17707]